MSPGVSSTCAAGGTAAGLPLVVGVWALAPITHDPHATAIRNVRIVSALLLSYGVVWRENGSHPESGSSVPLRTRNGSKAG
jgi:hypothetical protein